SSQETMCRHAFNRTRVTRLRRLAARESNLPTYASAFKFLVSDRPTSPPHRRTRLFAVDTSVKPHTIGHFRTPGLSGFEPIGRSGGLSMVRLAVVVGLAGLLSSLIAPSVWAQQSSGITGVVRDNSGAVLPGATVEAASP